MDRTPKHNNAPDSEQLQQKMITETQSQQLSSPSGGAHVAGADMGSDAQTNGYPAENACPAGTSKLDDHGRGGFPAGIEAEWCRFINYQQGRLMEAGERFPHVMIFDDGTGVAGSLLGPDNKTPGRSLEDAVNNRLEYLNNADARKAAQIAKLEAELANLKGEGVAVS